MTITNEITGHVISEISLHSTDNVTLHNTGSQPPYSTQFPSINKDVLVNKQQRELPLVNTKIHKMIIDTLMTDE